MRSMGRRGSHRLRIRRRFAEKALITFPFHDPSPNQAVTIANELRERVAELLEVLGASAFAKHLLNGVAGNDVGEQKNHGDDEP